MIISLFGPDGVGKTTVAKKFSGDDWEIINGTDVSSWPDQTWIRDIESRGLFEPAINDGDHFEEKIKRLHKIVDEAVVDGDKNVLIDSDPLHKTLMHGCLKGRSVQARYANLKQLIPHSYRVEWLHIYLTTGENDSPTQTATTLFNRVQSRAETDSFDPKSVEECLEMIYACEKLAAVLQRNGKNVASTASDSF